MSPSDEKDFVERADNSGAEARDTPPAQRNVPLQDDILSKFGFLKDAGLSDDLKKFLIDKSLEADNSSWTRRLEEKKWRWSTPLAVALTGLITLGGNFFFDYWKAGRTQSLEEMTTEADARRKASAEERGFEFKIVERELTQDDKSEGDRARVLLFLVRAGVLNGLNKDELTKMATASLEKEKINPNDIGVPTLGLRTPISSPDASILETTSDLRASAKCLADAGFKYVARYYRPAASIFSSLTQDEARSLNDAGIKIIAIYEGSNSRDVFSESSGIDIGSSTFTYARTKVQQPGGTAIFFAVDFDASDQDITDRVIPFFRGLKSANEAKAAPGSRYRIGVYGSGLVIQRLQSAGLIDVSWLAGSMGWSGTAKARSEGIGELRQINFAPPAVCGVSWGSTNAFKANVPDSMFAFSLLTSRVAQ
jgi:hypothetical protein